MTGPKIIRLFENVHMGLSHDGLALLCKNKFNIRVERLEDSEMLMFLNRKKDKLKVIGKRGMVIGYIRDPKGHRIALEAIQYLPQTFGAHGFNYDEALKIALEERLKTSQQRVGPLQVYRAMRAADAAVARARA